MGDGKIKWFGAHSDGAVSLKCVWRYVGRIFSPLKEDMLCLTTTHPILHPELIQTGTLSYVELFLSLLLGGWPGVRPSLVSRRPAGSGGRVVKVARLATHSQSGAVGQPDLTLPSIINGALLCFCAVIERFLAVGAAGAIYKGLTSQVGAQSKAAASHRSLIS